MEKTEELKEKWLPPFEREFVDKGLLVEKWSDLEPYFKSLLDEPLDSSADLEKWFLNWSELSSVADEYCSQRYIEMTCHTDDEEKTNAYLSCVRDIQPQLTKWDDKLNRKYMESPHRSSLDEGKYSRLDRMIRESVELFDEKNIPLQVKLSELSQKYQSIVGAMTVTFDGEEKTMPQMGVYLKENNRERRKLAFELMVERRLKDKDVLDDLFDELLALRVQWAKNLKLSDYREYSFRSKLRDYTPEDCEKFHDAIEKTAVPLARKISERRKKELGVEALAPWDMACDTKGLPPLKPFSKPDDLFDGVAKIFSSVDERLGEMFSAIGFSMDLESRKGKAPGGYQATLAEARIPFIFTNSAGTQDDVNTLLHEGGHAFHTVQCRNNPLIWYRGAGMEFSEVASMSMELLGGDRLEPFYNSKEDRERAKRDRMESIVSLFAWVAQVDAFQSWIYINPNHTKEERTAKWVELHERFNTGSDWSQTPEGALEYSWHRQLHIFEVPFYYIEYAIAQLGALQVYTEYRKAPERAVESYLSALSEGGSLPPKELFESAGIKLDFSASLLENLMGVVAEELGL